MLEETGHPLKGATRGQYNRIREAKSASSARRVSRVVSLLLSLANSDSHFGNETGATGQTKSRIIRKTKSDGGAGAKVSLKGGEEIMRDNEIQRRMNHRVFLLRGGK